MSGQTKILERRQRTARTARDEYFAQRQQQILLLDHLLLLSRRLDALELIVGEHLRDHRPSETDL